MRSHLANAEPRECPICHEQFTPLRKNQMFCSPPKRCRYTNQARTLATAERAAEYKVIGQEKICSRCEHPFTVRRVRQKICGPACPGRPDLVRTCANPACHLSDRQFVIRGGSQGKGNQQFCSRRCRDHIARQRWEGRFRRYGMTRAEYAAQADAQKGLCASCGQPPKPNPKHPGLVADHDHSSGKNRELLCNECNLGMGMFNDNPALLRAAADYIEHHRA